jgi:hypothetical protein
MKTIIKISIIILLLTLNSCITDYANEVKFIYENKSDYEIKLGVEFTDDISLPTKYIVFTIGIGSQINHSYVDMGQPNRIPFGNTKRSPITISFDDTVSVLYRWNDDSPYNPLKLENYSEVAKEPKKGAHKHTYTYTFTNADFEAALKEINQP